MEMKEIKKTNIQGYEVECPSCNKLFNSTSWEQLNYNYRLHYKKCNKKPLDPLKTSEKPTYGNSALPEDEMIKKEFGGNK